MRFCLFFCRAAEGINIINQLDVEVFTTVISYVHKNMTTPPEAAQTAEDDGGLEKSVQIDLFIYNYSNLVVNLLIILNSI